MMAIRFKGIHVPPVVMLIGVPWYSADSAAEMGAVCINGKRVKTIRAFFEMAGVVC